jgi:hypothetical protein
MLAEESGTMYRTVRFPENPLIHSGLDDEIGKNINGPSLIHVPDWVLNGLGRYYLYFAHHEGTHIRMAYADDIRGPWKIFRGGVLKLEETSCRGHIASPDVHIHTKDRKIVMYFHGYSTEDQQTFRAVSQDGVHFRASPTVLGPFYFRVFRHRGVWFAIAKTTESPGGGVLLRSQDGIQGFERGPDILPKQRHAAVLKRGDHLQIFFSQGEDCPERILVSTMHLSGDWKDWRPSAAIEVLRPKTEYEGGTLPLLPSRFGPARERVNQVRDPAVYEEDGRLYLLYTGAGETNICGAELVKEKISQPADGGDD